MAKRGQNEGSIYKRSDGRWTSAINLGHQNGKLKRQHFYGKTRDEVASKLIEALQKNSLGEPVAFKRETVAQFLDRWLEDCVRPSVRGNTYSSYEQNLRLHVKPNIGTLQLNRLGPQHIQSFMNLLLREGRSPRLVHYQRAILRTALNQALKWNLVSRNVATLVDPLRYRKREIVPFTADEAHRFLECIRGDALETVFHLALSLGLREGEVLGLKWTDIDFKTRAISIRNSLQRIDKRLQLVELKTERSRRTLPIPDSLLWSFKRHRTDQLKQKMSSGEDWQDSGLVFTTGRRTPLSARNVIRSYHRLPREAKLPRHRFHDLRHSCASFLLAKNIPPRTVMEILGHSNISLTMNTYAHVMPEMLRDAAKAMNTLLAGSDAKVSKRLAVKAAVKTS
jgi:integrase